MRFLLVVLLPLVSFFVISVCPPQVAAFAEDGWMDGRFGSFRCFKIELGCFAGLLAH